MAELPATNNSFSNQHSSLDSFRAIHQKLNLNENFFSVIQATIVDGLIITDARGKIVYANRAAHELLGVKNEIVGVSRRLLITQQKKYLENRLEYLYDPFVAFAKTLKGEVLTSLTILVHGEKEKSLDTSYSPLYDKNGLVVAVIADFRDVSLISEQQKEITRQLAISNNQRRRWEALFASVEEGICVTDNNGYVLEVNPSLELLSGYLEKEIIGKKYWDIFKCHDQKGGLLNDSLLKKALITLEPVPYDEHLHTGRDGEEFWVGTSCAPLVNEQGKMECLFVVRDINTYKQVEKLKSEFVSIASHELRTPLTIVNGYLSLLTSGDLGKLTDPDLVEQHETILRKVYMETKRLSSLVEDLLNISRIEDGRLKVDLQPTDIAKLARETVSEYQIMALDKNLKLEFFSEAKSMIVRADENRLKQVLTNLIDNALKYTEKGGVKVKVVKDNNQVVASVTDTGVGIDPKLKSIIFKKFQQANGSYLKENLGTGLGLFIVKGIIDLHHGRIWVDSKPGSGTTFYFSLPTTRH